MKLTAEQIRHVAKLARLALDEATIEAYRGQLSQVLDAFDVLAQVPAQDAAAPTDAHVPSPRADEVAGELPRERAFADAPQTQAGGYVLPKVIE